MRLVNLECAPSCTVPGVWSSCFQYQDPPPIPHLWSEGQPTKRGERRQREHIKSGEMSRLSSGFDLPLIFLCSLIQTLTLTPPPNNALLAILDMYREKSEE